MKVEVRGLKEIDRILGELPKAVARRELREIGKAVLDPMAAMAAQLAPERLGKLAFSIAVSERRTQRVRERFDKRTGLQMAMGPATGLGTLYYATHVEFGTVDTTAQPYMRPAWDARAAPALEQAKDLLWTRVQAAGARNARRQAKRG